jgi:hypothetical protein
VWVLIYVGLYGSAPMMVATTEYWGTYDSHEECVVAMRESEFGVQYTDEALICLEVNARDDWGFKEPVPGDGSLY